MPLDNPQYPNALNPSNPQNSDNAGQGAAHIRKLSAVIQNTFPELAGAITLTHEAINALPKAIETESETREQADTTLTEQLAETNTALADLKKAFDDFKAEYDKRDFVLESLKKAYPVGTPFVSFSDKRNPSEILGFGTWVAESQGRVLIGAGSATDSRGESQSFSAGATGGAFKHKQTRAELPAEGVNTNLTYGAAKYGSNNYNTNEPLVGDPRGANKAKPFKTENLGSGHPFNIVQPYKVVYVWRRTA